ncbi:CrcB-like protein-domain-containing protein [Xylariaceae sp. FL0255]|nr:CrcB-like protein-domain-containing protein [Xylariaceae sp. FL0255]
MSPQSSLTSPGRENAPSAGEDYDPPDLFSHIPEIEAAVHELDPAREHEREPRNQNGAAGKPYAARKSSEYDVPDSYFHAPEVEAAEHELDPYRLTSQNGAPEKEPDAAETPEQPITEPVSRTLTELYTVSYLILFAILGTLARLGLQALTVYPDAPVSFSSVWPNLAGSFVMGFLAEDRKLFRFEWGTPTYDEHLTRARGAQSDDPQVTKDLAAAKKAHLATKKTIPLYIGLATGFCGSFTSFSSFVRDVFLALSNDLPATPGDDILYRNGGYSFLALLAVIIGTVSLSFTGFHVGTQLSSTLESVTPSLPFAPTRKFLDPAAVVLGWGSWVGAIILSAVPPDRFSNSGAAEVWRGSATLALVFAPLGCLLRFYLSALLNPRLPPFPLGTFTVNMLGTAVLGLSYDLAHVPEGGVIGCQVLQGIEDGFCGCLSTVSTWITELAVLGRRRAYVYGGTSVVSGLALMVAIIGGLRWSDGFSELLCIH